MKKHLLGIIFLLLGTFVLSAQNVSFVASANVEKIANNQYKTYLGEFFEVNFTVYNGVGKSFVPPNWSDFAIKSGPNAFSMEQITNGVRQSKYGYSYTLQPKKAGRFVIPSAKINVQGTEYQTVPMVVEVIKETSSNKNADNGNPALLRIRTDKKTYFVGEQIELNYELLTTVSVQDYEITNQPDWKNFLVQNIQVIDNQPINERKNGKSYQVFSLEKKILFAQQSGDLTTEPLSANLSIVQQERNRNGFSIPSSTMISVESEPLHLSILDLPSTDKPDFSGAIGSWELSMTGDKQTLSTDETLSLSLTIQGKGDPKRIILPKLKVSDSLEVYEPKTVEENISLDADGRVVAMKKVVYLIVPKYAGTYTIRPSFTYFDTDEKDYTTIQTSPFPITVTQGKGVVADNPTTPTVPKTENRVISWPKTIALLLGVLIAGWMAWRGFNFLKKRKKTDVTVEKIEAQTPSVAPTIIATKPVEKTLIALAEENLAQEDFSNFYKNIQKSIVEAVAQKYRLPVQDISETSLANHPSIAQREEIIALLKTCSMARFGGFVKNEVAQNVLEQAKEIISKLSYT
jgi:BatD DUF11 like domain